MSATPFDPLRTADHTAPATKADIDAMIAAQDARFYRAMWLQGGAIVAILAALRFLPA